MNILLMALIFGLLQSSILENNIDIINQYTDEIKFPEKIIYAEVSA